MRRTRALVVYVYTTMASYNNAYTAIYLENDHGFEVLFFERKGKVVELKSKHDLPKGAKVNVKDAPLRKTMTFGEVRFYLDNLKYLIRKDTHPCKQIEIMSGIYPSVIITPEEFTDTTIDAILHSLDA